MHTQPRSCDLKVQSQAHCATCVHSTTDASVQAGSAGGPLQPHWSLLLPPTALISVKGLMECPAACCSLSDCRRQLQTVRLPSTRIASSPSLGRAIRHNHLVGIAIIHNVNLCNAVAGIHGLCWHSSSTAPVKQKTGSSTAKMGQQALSRLRVKSNSYLTLSTMYATTAVLGLRVMGS